jgi:hypothetical protein
MNPLALDQLYDQACQSAAFLERQVEGLEAIDSAVDEYGHCLTEFTLRLEASGPDVLSQARSLAALLEEHLDQLRAWAQRQAPQMAPSARQRLPEHQSEAG